MRARDIRLQHSLARSDRLMNSSKTANCMTIHPTAIIAPKAEINSEAEIGPYVVIDGAVKSMGGTRVMAHAYLTGWTEIGADNEIHPGAVLGGAPQDRAYKGQQTFLRIAD